jgi:hypothetical protein
MTEALSHSRPAALDAGGNALPRRTDAEAWARHAAASNGFGDGVALSSTTRRSTMQAQMQTDAADAKAYAKCVEVSKRVRWEIERDVIRGRAFDFDKKFMPDGLSHVARLPFLSAADARFFSQVQGRTYANMFGLVERFIGPKILEVSREHWFGDQTAFEALVRFTDEELKHQELFRRIDRMCAAGMPEGYKFLPDANAVASVVLGKSTWSVLALICHIEIFVLAHYRQAIEPDSDLSTVWKDVFTFHAREESQHAILDEIEWKHEDAKISAEAREQAVGDLIDLVAAVDGLLQMQARADTEYFVAHCAGTVSPDQQSQVASAFLGAYRWQYIVSGVQEPRFAGLLQKRVSDTQMARIGQALAPILN